MLSSSNEYYQLRQSIEIVSNNKTQSTKTEATTSFSKSSGQESEMAVKVIQTFQSLSLLDTKPLSTMESRLCTLLLKGKKNQLDQSENVEEFRGALEGLLINFSNRITESTNTAFITALQHDLKNKNLMEIFNKYYTHSTIQKDTLLAHFAPYLGNQEKIQKLAGKEAESLFPKIESHMEFFATNRDELMSVLIKQKQDKNPHLNCYVIDMCDLPACIEGLKKLKDSLSFEQSQRIQVLVRNDVHYTGVDIELSKAGVQAVVMDAAGDLRCKKILSELQQLECESLYVLGLRDSIQFDKFNCAFFSFDSVNQSSKDPYFFNLLSTLHAEKQEGYLSLAWKNTPPRYVRNATSLTFMKNYHAGNPNQDEIYKDNETFASYVNKHIGKRMIGENMRDAHTVLEDKFTKKKPKITDMLQHLPAKELSNIINDYSAQALLANILKQL